MSGARVTFECACHLWAAIMLALHQQYPEKYNHHFLLSAICVNKLVDDSTVSELLVDYRHAKLEHSLSNIYTELEFRCGGRIVSLLAKQARVRARVLA